MAETGWRSLKRCFRHPVRKWPAPRMAAWLVLVPRAEMGRRQILVLVGSTYKMMCILEPDFWFPIWTELFGRRGITTSYVCNIVHTHIFVELRKYTLITIICIPSTLNGMSEEAQLFSFLELHLTNWRIFTNCQLFQLFFIMTSSSQDRRLHVK